MSGAIVSATNPTVDMVVRPPEAANERATTRREKLELRGPESRAWATFHTHRAVQTRASTNQRHKTNNRKVILNRPPEARKSAASTRCAQARHSETPQLLIQNGSFSVPPTSLLFPRSAGSVWTQLRVVLNASLAPPCSLDYSKASISYTLGSRHG